MHLQDRKDKVLYFRYFLEAKSDRVNFEKTTTKTFNQYKLPSKN